jgi:tetraprenyl-beta-curcumene synthase
LKWWEFAAAAGSQFQVYGPLFALFCSRFEAIDQTYHAYFPAMSSLHVLLDDFIDQREDAQHGELNFVACAGDPHRFRSRARMLAHRARSSFATLAWPQPHTFALRLMILFYLTHPKVYEQGLDHEACALLAALS